jgi:hypothetical protein
VQTWNVCQEHDKHAALQGLEASGALAP